MAAVGVTMLLDYFVCTYKISFNVVMLFASRTDQSMPHSTWWCVTCLDHHMNVTAGHMRHQSCTATSSCEGPWCKTSSWGFFPRNRSTTKSTESGICPVTRWGRPLTSADSKPDLLPRLRWGAGLLTKMREFSSVQLYCQVTGAQGISCGGKYANSRIHASHKMERLSHRRTLGRRKIPEVGPTSCT